jgi:hypothetical protein
MVRRNEHDFVRSASRRQAATAGLMMLSILTTTVAGTASVALAQPGGFLETTTSTAVRPPVSVSLPTRGKFTFPAPYNTTGIRVTTASDCNGADCVDYVGYSYWRNMNNHVGSDTMYLFLGLDRNKGGSGPTLFSYNKVTDQVTNLGPLFDASNSLGWATGEQWYWSATQPTKLYVWAPGTPFYRYDVVTKQLQPIFDVATQFGTNRYMWQPHSSNDDKTHSGTLRSSLTYAMLGCYVFHEDTGQFSYYEKRGDFDECQVDKSGRWLLIKENVDGSAGEDNVIIDLQSGAATTFLDQAGAAGHSDNGFGYMVAADNWNNLPGAVRAWTFGQPFPTSQPGTSVLPQGRIVYHTTDWNTDIGHLSHANARPGVPLDQQYACGGGASRQRLPRSNEIVCFPLDGSLRVLVVAPVMTDLDATGGGDDYGKMPKGNLDVTGQYFIWTSNVGGSRLDAFIVKVPSQLISGVIATVPASAIANSSTTGMMVPTGTAGQTLPGMAVPATWINPVNVAVTGNSLKKTSGCDGCADAGAATLQRINAVGDFVEFTASETGSLRYFGLNQADQGTGTSMKFGIRLQGTYAEVREGGVYRTDTPFGPGDVFRIRIGLGGIVKYFKNGTQFYKSTQAPVDPSVPMLVDAALQNIGATITNVIIYTSPRP